MDNESLRQLNDLGFVEFAATQYPLLGWALLSFLSVFVFMPIVGTMWMEAVVLPWCLLSILSFIFGLSYKRQARLRITQTTLQVDAWVGRLGRPVQRSLPLESLQTDYRSGGSINGRPIYRLTLTPADGDPLKIRRLGCTARELRQVQQVLADAAEAARKRHGAGEAEIPPGLRQMQHADK